jgi:hypothetical protein
MKPSIENIQTTIDGTPVKDLRWIEVDQIIVGLVKDPLFGKASLRDGYVSCVWNKHGYPSKTNKGRTELNLFPLVN